MSDQPTQHDAPAISPLVAWGLMLGLGLGIWSIDGIFDARPYGVQAWGWRLFAIFVPTILGLMLRPMPGGALVLLAITLTLVCRALPSPTDGKTDPWRYAFEKALSGYANDSVWMVLAAYFLARALIKTGLARRIALFFVRLLGKSTLGLSYALVATDTVLASVIPSNAARVGGVILPIARSMAELYKSLPGASAALLGTYLMVVIYQADVVNCALYLTGQASNPIAVDNAQKVSAAQAGHDAQKDGSGEPDSERIVNITYPLWTLYALAPALVCLLVVPYLTYRWCRPQITHTPEAADMARHELAAMGPPSRQEIVLMFIFVGVCFGWIFGGLTIGKYSTGLVALIGAGLLFVSGILTWDDAVSEKGAWDVFIWYGGLVQLGALLNETDIIKYFAESVGDSLQGHIPLALCFGVMLLIYFYAHYAFASITAHILAMYPAFVGVLLAMGAPPWLTTMVFAYFANLCAGLTHYGTTPAPIVFGTQYVTHRIWWKIGYWMSLVNIAIWLGVGLPWWKLWGLW